MNMKCSRLSRNSCLMCTAQVINHVNFLEDGVPKRHSNTEPEIQCRKYHDSRGKDSSRITAVPAKEDASKTRRKKERAPTSVKSDPRIRKTNLVLKQRNLGINEQV